MEQKFLVVSLRNVQNLELSIIQQITSLVNVNYKYKMTHDVKFLITYSHRKNAETSDFIGVTMGKGPRVNRKGFPTTLDIISCIRERGNLFDSRSTFQIVDTTERT